MQGSTVNKLILSHIITSILDSFFCSSLFHHSTTSTDLPQLTSPLSGGSSWTMSSRTIPTSPIYHSNRTHPTMSSSTIFHPKPLKARSSHHLHRTESDIHRERTPLQDNTNQIKVNKWKPICPSSVSTDTQIMKSAVEAVTVFGSSSIARTERPFDGMSFHIGKVSGDDKEARLQEWEGIIKVRTCTLIPRR